MHIDGQNYWYMSLTFSANSKCRLQKSKSIFAQNNHWIA
jgi:hypothetical protein